MCEAIEEMLKEYYAKGYAEGFQEALAGLVRNVFLSIQTAATRANMSQSEFEAVMKKYAT